MNPQIKYILVASALLTFFWLIYLIIFRKEKNFKQRRFYLLTAVLFSLLIPLANVIIELPGTMLPLKETAVFDTSTFDFTQQQQQQQQITDINNSNFTVPEISDGIRNSGRKIEGTQLITYLYYAIAAVMLLRILVQLLVLQFHVSQSEVIKKQGYKLVINHHYKSTFSFFHWIFVHSSTKNDSGLDKIIMHERVHVRENHSIDTFFFEVVCSVMWFNPFVWFMRNSIQLVHEFLADEGAINMGIDKLQYQVLMINQVAEADVVSLTSHFNSSTLKKRIKMITQSDSYTRTKYRILGILPVALILILSIALFNGCNQQKVIEKKMASDSVIKAVFNKNEIKELAEIRLMMDQMVLAQTGETDTKTAYEKFIASLGKVENAAEISGKIPLSHDSLVQIIKANSTFKEIWVINNKTKSTSISLNPKGKVMELLKQLSKENANYKAILEGIEIAGDISPSVISDFLMIPTRYNWESEAEKLYATTVLVILTNRPVSKADVYIQKAVKFIRDFNKDSALIWIDKAIAIDSTHFLALQTKAGILINTNNHREALDLLTKCTTIEPEIAETWGMMGMVNDYLGETEEASRCYGQTIALYNRQMESGDKQKIYIAKINIAMMLRMNNQENESRLLFRELLNENPADSTVANLSRLSKQDFLNNLKPYQIHGGHKEKPIITIKNSADYSPVFIDEFKKSMLGYKTIHLDKNKIIINGTHVEYFPGFIPIGKKITMKGKNDAIQVELEFTRINQTTIRYSFKAETDTANQFAENGEAHLPAYFFLGDESIVDDKTWKGYFGHDFIDQKTETLIKIVEGEENKLLAIISSQQFGKSKCPVLFPEK